MSANSPLKTILIIDDDPAINQSLVALLQGQGYEVAAVHAHSEGLPACRQVQVDLVIADTSIPHIRGWEIIGQLKKAFPHLKLIALTGGPTKYHRDYLQTARIMGADYGFAHPINEATLLHAVAEELNASP